MVSRLWCNCNLDTLVNHAESLGISSDNKSSIDQVNLQITGQTADKVNTVKYIFRDRIFLFRFHTFL